MILETLLSAAIETGIGLLVEVGVGNHIRDLQERLTKSGERRRREAFERAFTEAQQASGEEVLRPLLDDRQFQEAVVNGLLDPARGFDVRATTEVWKDSPPEHARALRRFFTTLENTLLADDLWGPILDRYQQHRFRREVQQALEARNLALSSEELVRRVSAHLSGSGAMAMSGGAAAGAGGAAVVGNVGHIVLQQIIIQSGTRVDARDLRQRYLTRFRNYCLALPLPALGGDAAPQKSVTLDQVYIELNTEVNVLESTLEKITRGELVPWSAVRDERVGALHASYEVGTGEAPRRVEQSEEVRPLPALDTLRLASRVALLGEPGAGKSTFARIVMARLAEGNPPPGLSTDLLPVLVVLRDLAPSLSRLDLGSLPGAKHDEALADAVRDQMMADLAGLDSSGFAEELLEALNARRCLLTFDGLDEVPREWRGLVRRAVAAVLKRYDPPRVIVTCRQRSYVGEAILPNFDSFTLAPFTADQIDSFARAWYNAQKDLGRVDAVQARNKAMDLAQAALTPDLRELASNPMLLTTMALIHQQEVGLPKERVRLYSKAVDLLLYRWQREKVAEDGLAAFLRHDRHLRQVIERLAYEAHLTGQGSRTGEAGDLPRHHAQDILEDALGDAMQAREFLNYVDQRAGILVGRGGEPGRPAAYSFPHRTVQEYLAGCYLLTGSDSDRVREFYTRAAEGDRWNLVAQLGVEELFYNTRNGEGQLLHLAYNLLAEDLADEQAQRAALWSGQMADLAGRTLIERDTSSPTGGKTYLRRLRPRLVKLLSGAMSAPERHSAGVVLARLGDPRFRANAWYLPNEPLLGFVEIPAGSFLMGSDTTRDPLAFKDEMPQRKITLPRYYIARYPVTVAQFRAFVEESGHQPEDEDSLRGLPNHPVVNVIWHEALKYCDWLTARLRDWEKAPEPLRTLLRQEGWRVTLPSEAEWEKAARGTDGRTYPWGNDPDPTRANYGDTRIDTTSTVGGFPSGASPYEVQEMAGNVWEWTRSIWGDYPYPTDEKGRARRENLEASGDELRVVRGGAFWFDPRGLRCAVRGRLLPDRRLWLVGFRVVVLP